MVTPLRIEIPGGRYPMTGRGNVRREFFRDDRDWEHFLELLAELAERVGVLHQMSNARRPGRCGGSPTSRIRNKPDGIPNLRGF